ncbi:daptide-type RiPP [Streptomyces sp. NPDC048442]|uniref:daptide-type RiPP n=1 Tax=Streptomyces sp. NPDC048442 TaxID=3154823 RepID=UPI0034159B8B
MGEQQNKSEAVQANVDPTASLELGLQELEALEAPGFWTGFSAAASVSAAVSVSAVVAT